MRLAATFVFVCSLVPCYGGTILLTNSANQLLTIDSATPGTISNTLGISGLQAGETILGIDFRPANGQLWGLGSTSRLYTIDTATGAATQVGAAGAFTLSGTAFGFDFNPTVDRIRVTSNADQNLRLNPNNGTLAGTDTNLNPGDPNIAGSAYTNNFAGALTTTLYGIDSVTDQLFIQNPPNAGILVLVGSLGVNAGDNLGFDIGLGDTAYAALIVPGGNSGLYTINLATGAATLLGIIGSGQTITGLAVAPIPEPATFGLIGIGSAALLYFGRRRSRKP